jgi:hypothetical protein
MSLEEKWKVLADLLIELQKRGEKIPTDVVSDLRSAKTMIQVLKADRTHIENVPKIDTYLRSVESYVIFTAEKLKETQKVKPKEKPEVTSRFIPGVPKDKNWVRIQISEDTPARDVKKLVEAANLSYKMDENGHMLVYGNRENVKSFMKDMTEKFRGARTR